VRQAKDGRRIDVSATISPIKDSAGKIVGASRVARDITERKRAEEELRRKTAFLEALVDSALDGILVVDSDGKQILQNQRMAELWKFPPHIAENTNDADKLRFAANQTKHPQQFADKTAYLYSHPDEISRDEIALIDGTVLERYSSPIRDKAGMHHGRIWTFRDITDRRKT
jgi:PAS domain-containing protein